MFCVPCLCLPLLLADFPDTFWANLYAKGLSNQDRTADEALGSFTVGPLLSLHTFVCMQVTYTHFPALSTAAVHCF